MAQLLPANEDFAAPDWLNHSSYSLTECLPWFFWYLGFNPTDGVHTTAVDGATYPYRSGAELESYGTQELYIETSLPGSGFPVLMTDTSAEGHEYQRSVLCREEDSVAVEDIDYTVVFGFVAAGGSALGSSLGGGSRGVSPTRGGRFPFPAGESTPLGEDHEGMTGGSGSGNWSSGGTAAGVGVQPPSALWAFWLGNSLFFRAGQKDPSSQGPQIEYPASPGTISRAWYCTHAAHYAFCAYPVIDAGNNRVDLYLELWQVNFSGTGATDGTARRVMQQIVQGGADSTIDFKKPYFLRVTCDNDGSSDVEMKAYIGEVVQTTGPNLAEAQCFKTDVFGAAGNNFVAGTSVTHTAATGLVVDAHADKIATYTNKSFGWGMGRDRTINVNPRMDPDGTSTFPSYMSGVEGVYSAQIKDISSGTTLYRDEFERSVIGGGGSVSIINEIVGLFGNEGNQANGLFTFDGYAEQYGIGLDEVRRLMLWTDAQTDITAPNDYVTLDYDADLVTSGQVSDVMRAFVHERPSTQYFNHHRSIDFKPGAENPTAGTPELAAIGYEIGIALRGYHDGNITNGTVAYLYWLTDAEETVTYASLTIADRNATYADASPGTNNTVLIARKAWSSVSDVAAFNTAYPLYDGNFHTLDFKVEIYAGATSPDSSAEYHVTLDGAPIELDDTTAPNQSSTVSPFPVVEPGPATYFGRQESFWFWSSGPEVEATGFRNYNPTQAKNWVEGAMTDDPDGPPGQDPDDQVSIVVGGEGAAVGSLNTSSGALGISGGGVWDVEVTVNVESTLPILRIPFDSGHTYTSPAASKARRRWRVSVVAADLAVYQALQLFYNSHNGMETPFSFVVPIPDDGTEAGSTAEATETVVAWFSSDSLTVLEVGPQVYNISFTVDEELVA